MELQESQNLVISFQKECTVKENVPLYLEIYTETYKLAGVIKKHHFSSAVVTTSENTFRTFNGEESFTESGKCSTKNLLFMIYTHKKKEKKEFLNFQHTDK